MASTDEEFDIEALGRPSFLGQTYNARSGKLLNYTLFPPVAIAAATRLEKSSSTINRYEEVRDSAVRASLLDVSASVSVSLLGGALDVKGSASYIDRSDSTQEALTISGIRAITNERRRLEVQDAGLQSSVVLTTNKMEQLGATHVVTAITYGAAIIGSLSETNYSLQKSSHISGQLSIKTLQGFGALTGAQGDAAITDDDKENISKYELEVRLVGDYLDSEVPVNAAALSMKLSQAADLLRVQIPVKLTVTSLQLFNRVSAEIFYRELDTANLVSFIRLYDELVTLSQRWTYQSGVVEQRGDELFPTLQQEFKDRARKAEGLLIEYRGELGAFLRDFRSRQGPSSEGATTAFTQERWLPRIRPEQKAYDDALSSWTDLGLVREYAASGGFPLVTVQALSAMMSEERRPVALVLVPPESLTTELINTYEGLAKAVRSIRADVNCCSVYADELLDKDLLLLDGLKQSVRLCLEHSRATSLASILTHGLLTDDSAALVDWRTGLQDGWAVQHNPITNAKYVGALVNGIPHGVGRMTYSDGRDYEGSWFRGNWDGPGTYRHRDTVIASGIFVDNVVDTHVEPHRAVMVDVTVYEGSVPVDAATVAVLCHAGPAVNEITSFIPAQVSKIADALGWKPGERHRLRTAWEEPRAFDPTGNRETIEDPIFDAELIPGYFDKRRSSISVVTNGSQLEAFEYVTDDLMSNGFDFVFRVEDKLWLDGDVGYVGLEEGRTIIGWVQRNIRELGETILVDAIRLPMQASTTSL